MVAWFDNSVRPKMKSFVQCKFGDSNDVKDLQVLSRAGKSSGIYKSFLNIRDLKDDSLSCIDWESVCSWRPLSSDEEVMVSEYLYTDGDILSAKLEELEKWKLNNVYETVDNIGQSYISTRWVVTEKFVEGTVRKRLRLDWLLEDLKRRKKTFQKIHPRVPKRALD